MHNVIYKVPVSPLRYDHHEVILLLTTEVRFPLKEYTWLNRLFCLCRFRGI